jgi:hypothetical protein
MPITIEPPAAIASSQPIHFLLIMIDRPFR